MARRTVIVRLSYKVVLDDDSEGLPFVRDPSDVALHGVRSTKGLTEIKDVKLDMALDRTSSADLRRRDRVVRLNTRAR